MSRTYDLLNYNIDDFFLKKIRHDKYDPSVAYLGFQRGGDEG